MRKCIFSSLLVGAFLICTTISALALSFTANSSNIYESGTPNGTLAATADFTIVGGQLQLVLTNTATYPASNPPDLLVALFFTINGAGLTDASLATASTLINAGTGALISSNTAVSDYWAYGSGLNVYSLFNYGVGSTGLSVSWAPISHGPQSNINGGDYSIVSAGSSPTGGVATGNANHLGQETPLVQDHMTFLFDYAQGFTLNNITGVGFQYNTSLRSTQVPEPTSLLLLGLGLIGVVGVRRMLKK